MDGNFSFEEYDEYLKFRNKLLDKVILPDVMLYLNASPETCYERIHKLRKRAGEEVIPLAYLTGIKWNMPFWGPWFSFGLHILVFAAVASWRISSNKWTKIKV